MSPGERLTCDSVTCERVAEWRIEVLNEGRREEEAMTVNVCDEHLFRLAEIRMKQVV